MIVRILSYTTPDFETFVTALPEFQAWGAYALRQKNMERVIEHTISGSALTKEFEVVDYNNKTNKTNN